jgi:hypothetical protein
MTYPDNQTYPRPGRKKRNSSLVWVVVIVMAILVGLALCGIGALVLGSEAVDSVVSQEASDRKADIKITSCSLEELGLVTIRYTVRNSSAQDQSYLPQFNIQNSNGTVVYGQAVDVVNDLAPGKDYEGSTVGHAEVPSDTKITCTLTSA